MEVEAGKECMKFEAGAFSYYGVMALSPPPGAGEHPQTLPKTPGLELPWEWGIPEVPNPRTILGDSRDPHGMLEGLGWILGLHQQRQLPGCSILALGTLPGVPGNRRFQRF